MKIADINPHIRFAEQITYSAKNIRVYVKDCRLFYILKGTGKIYIGNNELYLNKDTLFYCSGGCDYSIESDAPIQLYSLNFDLSQNHSDLTLAIIPEEFKKSNIYSPIDNCTITDSHFLNSFFILANGLNFKNTISGITEEFSAKKIFFREICGSALKNLLIELHRININKSDHSYDTVKKITDYIDSNFTKKITNTELASIAGYHEYYLNRLFIRYVGISMHKYMLNLRINEGKLLLLNTDLSISDIAFQVGFNSNTHFATYFKKETTMTPFEYRNNFRNNI